MDRSRFRFLPALVVVLLLSGFVAACGEDDGTPGATTTTSALSTATTAQTGAILPDPTEMPDVAGESVATATATVAPDAPPTEESIATEVPVSEPTQPAVEPETEDEPLPEPDNPAPEIFTAGDWYNSEPLDLAELRGEPVLLVFWATI